MCSSGSVVNGPLNTTTTYTNVNLDDPSNNVEDIPDIGVVGKGKLTQFSSII